MWGRLGSHSVHFPRAKTSAADKSGPHANYQPRARTSAIPTRWLSGPACSLTGSPRLSRFHCLLGSSRQSFLRRQRGAEQQTMIDQHAPSRSLSSQSSWLWPYKPGHLMTFPHPLAQTRSIPRNHRLSRGPRGESRAAAVNTYLCRRRGLTVWSRRFTRSPWRFPWHC
jgi:hypothetical protein